jgi:arylsulfatase A-like enzyme
VLVTIDTLRADRLSVYGYSQATSPNLDWLAARGVRFEHALAPSSSTAPTHASIFTGQLPSAHSIGAFNSQFALDDEWPTLAEMLRNAGYATAAIVSNPLLGRALGLDRGFDHYDDEARGEGRFAAKGRPAARAVDRALAWLDATPAEPFFVWLHLQDTHGPYAPDPDWICPVSPNTRWPPLMLPIGRDPSGYRAIPLYQVWDDARALARYAHRYDCELASLDAQLGRLLGRTTWDPRLRDALVVVTSDHGEAFGEDDFYFAHGHAIGLDQVRVPLLAAGAGLPAGRVVTTPVGLTALFASLLEAAGAAREAPAGSVSLLGLARRERGDRSDEGEPVFVESLNQVGIVWRGVFARRDLRPADDREFWQGGNPNGGGAYWAPLGGSRVRGLAEGTSVSEASARAALARLDAFAAQVGSAREARQGRRRLLELTPEQQAALRLLGYAD